MEKDTIKNTIEDYLTLTLWFCVHEDDKTISTEQFEAVLQEIGKVEESLRNLGVSQTAIDSLLDMVRVNAKTPIDRLSESEQLRLAKVIFGGETKWADDPHPSKQSLGKGDKDAKTM